MNSLEQALYKAAITAYGETQEAQAHYLRTLEYWAHKGRGAGKKCKHCQQHKHWDELIKDNSSRDGYRPECKQCYARINAERYKKRTAKD